MGWSVEPLSPERFEDFAEVINPRRNPKHCWCAAPRLRAKDVAELGGGDREAAMRALCAREHPPGVVGYLDGEPAAWCHISPRAEIPRLAESQLIPAIDDLPVWSILCVVVRTGYRGKGATTPLLEGAVEYAARSGAPAVEAYPVDPQGRMHATMAFVGTRSMFERVGFEMVGETAATSGGLPRVIMRRHLG